MLGSEGSVGMGRDGIHGLMWCLDNKGGDGLGDGCEVGR
jgi:hypothetical protein